MSDDPEFDAHCEANDLRRTAEPIGCDDTFARLAGLELALLHQEMTPRDRRLIESEVLRLKAAFGLLPLRAA